VIQELVPDGLRERIAPLLDRPSRAATAILPIRLTQAFRADVAFAHVLLRAELLVRLEASRT
jgi:hypothetical protein